MKYLIVAADDFGLSESINEGIAMAYKDGIVTMLNFLPSGEAFNHAVEMARELNPEEVGAHLSLTETSPVLKAHDIPSLVTGCGRFHKSRAGFFVDYFTGRVDMGEVYSELKAQLELLKGTGFRISTLSSHEHIHMMPAIFKIFLRLAGEYKIPSIRLPRNDRLTGPVTAKKIFKIALLAFFGSKLVNKPSASGVFNSGSIRGFADSGCISEELLINIIKTLDDGVTELICHPGFLSPAVLDKYRFHINCERELAALVSRRVKKAIDDNGIIRVKYSDVAPGAVN